jgi:hypothetical protein
MGRCLVMMACAAASFASPAVQAAPCVGFTDVDSTSVFCPNVEWLKNRTITTGCTLATLYCPGEPVTRAAMSLFLNRLGNALTTTNLVGNNSGSGLDIDTSPVLCQSADATAAYPRTAHGTATVLAYPSGSSSMDIAIGFVESTNQGATWTPVSPLSSWTAIGSGTHKGAVVLLPPRVLAAGIAYRWGIRVSRVAGSATNGDVGGWYCMSQLRVENRVSATSPFDDDDDE